MSKTKKVFSVIGILVLTLAGLLAIVVVRAMTAEPAVDLLGNGLVFTGSWDERNVSAKGTWVIDNERSASPLNAVDLMCLRDEKLCYEATSNISGGGYLDANLAFYHIVRWDESTIEFQATSAICTTSTYAISRATQKLTGRRLTKPDAKSDPLCADSSPDLKLSFVNGRDVVSALRRERDPVTLSIVVAVLFIVLMVAWAWRVIRK